MTMTLAVTERDESIKLNTLRANGQIPAVIYGPKQEPIAITLDEKLFDKIRKEAGESTVLEITGLKDTVEVLIKEVDFNPIKQQVLHVDLYVVEQGKEMTTHVPLHFVGEAPVEASREGSVTKVLHEIEVTCTPKNLPSHVDVDLSTLEKVEDKIHVSDLKVPAGVTITTEGEDSVAVVSAARQSAAAEEEEEAASVDMETIEVEKKGKEESTEE